jgi:hypothetical protein
MLKFTMSSWLNDRDEDMARQSSIVRTQTIQMINHFLF